MSTRNLVAFVVVFVIAAAAGWFGRDALTEKVQAGAAGSETSGASSDSPCPGGAPPLFWKAPMDSNFIRDEPGKSPMGMDLVPQCPSGPSAGAAGGILIDPVTMQNTGVRTVRAERRDLAPTIRAVGRIVVDERRVHHVHTKVQGWVEELFIEYKGQSVERGKPLLEIYSPELVATQEELLLAARYQDEIADSPHEDVRGSGKSLFDATLRRLQLWDVSDAQIEQLLETGKGGKTLTLFAPMSGVVTELGVRHGMEIDSRTNLFTIADLSRVWMVSDVYEQDLPWLEVGQVGEVEFGFIPGRRFRGEITYIAPFLDPETRTASVRLELPNPDGLLRLEMFGNTILRGTTREDVIAVPVRAVIRSGRRNIVFVATGGGRFEPRDVQLGLDPGEGWIEIAEGIAEGEDVVVSGQFLIDSESRLQEVIEKMRHVSEEGARESAEEEGR